jgi:hypothetical protein
VPRSLAASYTLVLHGALWFPITLLGFYFMARERVSWQDFRQAERNRESGIRESGIRDQEIGN